MNTRLNLYKRLAGIETIEQISEFKSELIDRFGLLPPEANNVLLSAKIKIPAKKMKIKSCRFSKDQIRVEFHSEPNIDPAALIHLIQTKPNQVKLVSNQVLKINCSEQDLALRAKSLLEVLEAIKS